MWKKTSEQADTRFYNLIDFGLFIMIIIKRYSRHHFMHCWKQVQCSTEGISNIILMLLKTKQEIGSTRIINFSEQNTGSKILIQGWETCVYNFSIVLIAYMVFLSQKRWWLNCLHYKYLDCIVQLKMCMVWSLEERSYNCVLLQNINISTIRIPFR